MRTGRRNRKKALPSDAVLENNPGSPQNWKRTRGPAILEYNLRATSSSHEFPSNSDFIDQIRSEIVNEVRNSLAALREELVKERISRNETLNDFCKAYRQDLLNVQSDIRNFISEVIRPEVSSSSPANPVTVKAEDNPAPPDANDAELPRAIDQHFNSNQNQNLINYPNSNSQITPLPSRLIEPNTYDGFEPWSYYHTQFEIAARYNGWSDEIKSAQLLTHLRGRAQSILRKIPLDDYKNYEKITKILSEEFSQKHLCYMYRNQLQIRKQNNDESFSSFAKDIERLAHLAYQDDSEELRERMACFFFINGILDTEIEFVLRSERIESLQKAAERASELNYWKIKRNS
uniref:Retrotransposon gag domain-containing protein n=1 Tax=Bracon brevicornis TaxID=1563983 RepID=A0A6V7HYL3_9HYME